MESEDRNGNSRPTITQRLLSAVIPVLFIAIGYIDPGKWAAAVEGGARFGHDFVMLMLVFNLAAILCHYLSAYIAVVTGRDLAQICSAEYDKFTCIFLGIQAELSMIALDLSMILGTAHGINLIFGMELFTCVFLTSVDAFLFPLLASFLETSKAKLLCARLASFILLSYLLGMLFSQPGMSFSIGGMLTKMSGESAFALMSLLGANVMPHNFYLHSSAVQQDQGPAHVSKEMLCQDHFFAILGIFSGIFLVNYMLMNSAASLFYTTGLDLLTFQDALSIMDQLFRSLMAPCALILVLFFSNHTTALIWKLSGQVVLRYFFQIDIPGWLHHATIRIISVIPALFCVWSSGAEGIYQLLILTQIFVALLLPSSVIPLFRIASSRSVMGSYKISHLLEFIVLIAFIGMLGLEVIFVIEMIFGNSDWASNLRYNMGSSLPVPYFVLLGFASVSFCLMLWLAATPLKSTSSRSDDLSWNYDIQVSEHESSRERDDCFIEAQYRVDDSMMEREPILAFERSLETEPEKSVAVPAVNLPEVLLDSESGTPLTTIEESSSKFKFSRQPRCSSEESATTLEMTPGSVVSCETSDEKLLNITTSIMESVELSAENTVRIEEDIQIKKEAEVEDSPKGSVGSFKNLTGRNDDMGSGTGSLSKLAGLGRAARRQLAAVLDEFWGQLFDFHGQPTQEAKTQKLDEFLGIDSKTNSKPSTVTTPKVNNTGIELGGYIPSVITGSSDSLIYETPRKQSMRSGIDSSYGVQTSPSSSLLSSQAPSFDTYLQSAGLSSLEYGERRYSSLRLPPSSSNLRVIPSSAGLSDQPATVHGYQIKSYINQLSRETNSEFNSLVESVAPKSPLSSSNYKARSAYHSGQKPQVSSPLTPPGFPDRAVSRNISLRSEYASNNIYASGLVEKSAVHEKKFHSMPDISGFSLPLRDSTTKFGTLGRKVNEPMYSGSSYSSRNASPFQLGSGFENFSMWSRQPFEQFGVAEKAHDMGGEVIGLNPSPITRETEATVDFEANLLRSLRHCIVKLLKLEGSDWLFRQNGGVDEDLIDRVAARERFLYEVETQGMDCVDPVGESLLSSERKTTSRSKFEDMDTKFLVTSVPNCGEGCVWRVDLIVSFGVWCIHRVLELSLMESRPELWGKYTYVLNRLQGIIDLAFSKPRTPLNPCFCLQLPVTHRQKSSALSILNGSLPPPAKQGPRGKCTTASMLLDIVKDVEIAISCRKGRTGTAAGDVAFPKGKENLASVLKRYKRRLSSKLAASQDASLGPRKASLSAQQSLQP